MGRLIPSLYTKPEYNDIILKVLVIEAESRCESADEIHAIVNALTQILKLTQKAAAEVTAGYEQHQCVARKPLPRYIYRVERKDNRSSPVPDSVNFEVIPRALSDKYRRLESDSTKQEENVIPPLSESGKVSDLVKEVGLHLNKTQNDNWDHYIGQEFLFRLVSLSGNFRWAVHTTCLRSRTIKDGQEGGLVIYDTSKIIASGVLLWHVDALLMFFNRKKGNVGSYATDERAREWARNADEYLCWQSVPGSAFVTFVPYERLIALTLDDAEPFLQEEIINTGSLREFKRVSWLFIPVDEYLNRVKRFMKEMTYQLPSDNDVDSFVHTMMSIFWDNVQWDHRLTGYRGSLMRELEYNIKAACAVYRSCHTQNKTRRP
ncbi:MAG: hypothetical protein Q9218_006446 [Villophora microphyllina]